MLSEAKDLLSSIDSRSIRALRTNLSNLLAANFCNTVAGRLEEN